MYLVKLGLVFYQWTQYSVDVLNYRKSQYINNFNNLKILGFNVSKPFRDTTKTEGVLMSDGEVERHPQGAMSNQVERWLKSSSRESHVPVRG